MKQLFILLLVLSPLTLKAQTLSFMSDFEAVNNGRTAFFDWTFGGTSGKASVQQNGRCLRAVNGGASTSYHCLKINPASGETGYAIPRIGTGAVDVAANLNINQAQSSHTFAFHPALAPTADYVTLTEAVETDASRGAWARLNSDDTITVHYGATQLGITAPVYERLCTGETNKSCNGTLGQCITSCASCTDGAGCAWFYVEIVQTNTYDIQGDTVQIDLWLNGEHLIVGSPEPVVSGLANIDYWVNGHKTGSVGTGGAEIYFDADRQGYAANVVVQDARLGQGPIYTIHPNGYVYPAETSMVAADANACGTSEPWTCLDDWTSGGAYVNDTALTETARARDDEVSAIAHDGDRITVLFQDSPITDPVYVSTLFTGRTNSGASHTFTTQIRPASCPDGVCVFGDKQTSVSTTGPITSTHTLRQSVVFNTSVTGAPWSQSAVDNLGIEYYFYTRSASTAAQRWGGALAYVAQNNPDISERTNIPDVDQDGVITVCSGSDSLGTATLTQNCATDASESCSGTPDYCEWATSKDIPASVGCQGNDDLCRTCSNTRTINGVGYYCDGITYLCGTGGSCDSATGRCNQNSNVLCDPNESPSICDDLGTCPSAADSQCLPACPDTEGDFDDPDLTSCTSDDDCKPNEECASVHGNLRCIGICPAGESASWTVQLCAQAPSDVACVTWGTGAQTTSGFALNDFPKVRNGQIPKTLGTGLLARVLKDPDMDSKCACAVPGDCATGTCTDGKCLSVSCEVGADCLYPSEQPECIAPFCDVFVDIHGTNDGSFASPHAPECRGRVSFALPECQGWDSNYPTSCTLHSTCTGIYGTESLCYPTMHIPQNAPLEGLHVSTTPAVVAGCVDNADCTSNICWDGDADTSGAGYALGFCGCTTDAHCPGTAVCVDAEATAGVQGVCRPFCVTSDDCTGSDTCSSGACTGTCSVPCSSRPCTTDKDCIGVVTTGAGSEFNGTLGRQVQTNGYCDSGFCAGCGESDCAAGPATAVDNARRRGGFAVVDALQHMTNQTANDTYQPIFIWVTPMTIGLASKASCTDIYRSDAAALPGVGPLVQYYIPVWSGREFLLSNAALMRALRPDATFDLQALYDRDRSLTVPWHSDAVHLTNASASYIGKKLNEFLRTIGACVEGTGINRVALKYCQAGNGEWRDVGGGVGETCTTALDCNTTGDSCKYKTCTLDSDCNETTDIAGCEEAGTCDYCNELANFQ